MPVKQLHPEIVARPSDRELSAVRFFGSPRDLVFKALTDRDWIPRWWGPRGMEASVERMDVEPEGIWRLVLRDSGSREFAFNGVYREIVPPERVSYYLDYEGKPDRIQIVTANLEKLDGGTLLFLSALFQNAEDLETTLRDGLEKGLVESLGRLGEQLAGKAAEAPHAK